MNAIRNNSRVAQRILLASALLFATSAFAANKGSLELHHPTQVAGKELAAGNYNVQWEGSGDNVQLSITQGKKQVASTTARVVQTQNTATTDSALITMNPDGSRTLAQIRLRGKPFALDLNGQGGGAGASGAGR